MTFGTMATVLSKLRCLYFTQEKIAIFLQNGGFCNKTIAYKEELSGQVNSNLKGAS